MNSKKFEDKAKMNNKKSITNKLKKIRSHYFLRNIFILLCQKKSLDIIKYNKQLQNIMQVNLNIYKKYSETYSSIEIDIELEPIKDNKIYFFYMQNDKKRENYHLYINDEKKEEKGNKLDLDKLKKYKIIIDYEVTSFYKLFDNCKYIKSIECKKFIRNICSMDVLL